MQREGRALASDDKEMLHAGGTYIVDEAVPRLSLALFESELSTGRDGLYITSEPVEQARRRLGAPEKTEVVWVTDVSAPGAIKPAMIDQINARRERFLEKRPKTIILLDIFSSLTSANEFSNVFKFFNYIRDDTHHRNSMTVISLDSRALEQAQYRRIRRLARDVFSDENPPEPYLPDFALEEGKTYILKSGERRGYKTASAAARAGRRVLCIVRGFPDSVKKGYDLPDEVELCWLTRTGHPGALRPDHVPELAQRVQKFLSPGNGLVLLDGLDILVAENGFTEFYRILSHIKDLTRLTKGILLVTVPTGSLSFDDMRKLSQDADVV